MRYIERRQPTEIDRLLTWTHRDQRADRVLDTAGPLHAQEAALDGEQRAASSRDGVASMQRIGTLGTRIDASAPSSATCHPDAETIHTAVMTLPRPVALFVINHARKATRPDSEPIVPPQAFPVLNRLERPTIRYEPWDKGRNYGHCPVEWTVSPTTEDRIRAEYDLWRRTLSDLAASLTRANRLINHRAMPPTAPETPDIRIANDQAPRTPGNRLAASPTRSPAARAG